MKCHIVAFLLLTASIGGQVEHAPTVAQCQADQRLWLSELEESAPHLPAYDVLTQWQVEMRDCKNVDPSNYWTYYNTQSEIGAEKSSRMKDFLDRHDLWTQFKQEDTAGKR
jgi:hypothetical protein